MTISVDEEFKLAATGFQFGNFMECTIPVFHQLAQYMQGLYESTNFINLLTPLSCFVSVLPHLLKINAKCCHNRVTFAQSLWEWLL